MRNVSVAMAVYNGEKYIKEQIDSILCQFNLDDQLVISYDKSSDNTESIILDYARQDSRVSIVYNENAGVFGNFENAIGSCKNEIIMISDQDDIWMPNKIDIVKKVFQQKEVDLIIHNGVHINEQGLIISKPFFELYKIGNSKLKNFIKPRYSGCCLAFHRRLLMTILPIPRNVGAYDHWIGSVGEHFGKVEFVDEVLIYHRLHGNNVTPTSRRKLSVILIARLNLLFQLFVRRMRK